MAAAIQTTTLAVTLHHMLGGSRPVTRAIYEAVPHTTQVTQSHCISLTSWLLYYSHSLPCLLWSLSSCLSLDSLWLEKLLAAASSLSLCAPLLLLCPGSARPGLTQHDWGAPQRNSWDDGIRDELSLDCHKKANSHKCSLNNVLWSLLGTLKGVTLCTSNCC